MNAAGSSSTFEHIADRRLATVGPAGSVQRRESVHDG